MPPAAAQTIIKLDHPFGAVSGDQDHRDRLYRYVPIGPELARQEVTRTNSRSSWVSRRSRMTSSRKASATAVGRGARPRTR